MKFLTPDTDAGRGELAALVTIFVAAVLLTANAVVTIWSDPQASIDLQNRLLILSTDNQLVGPFLIVGSLLLIVFADPNKTVVTIARIIALVVSIVIAALSLYYYAYVNTDLFDIGDYSALTVAFILGPLVNVFLGLGTLRILVPSFKKDSAG
jgi:hypothetical protein